MTDSPEPASSGVSLDGACDLHVHAGPDVRPRRVTARELVARAARSGMGGLVLKHHHTSTVLQAAALQDDHPTLVVAGSIVLNEPVGGINPRAAEAALRLGARVVWMPTMDAAQERQFYGKPGGLSCLDREGRLSSQARDVIALVAEYGAVLGTGHLGAAEVLALLPVAREAGATVVISHPEIRMLDFSVAQQRMFHGDGVWFERAYPRSNFTCDWDGLAAHIRDVGVESSVIGTDLGQADSIDPIEGLRDMLAQLRARGFTDTELRGMASERSLGLLRGR
jgi:hypothetical protein